MGGLFGGGDDTKKQTSTTTGSPYPAAKPGLDLFYKNLTNAYKAGDLRQTPYMGETVAPVAPETSQAWTGIANRASAGSPLNTMSADYVSRVLNPDYLNSDSPGLQSVIDRSRQGVNAEFARAGRTFSGAHAGALGSGEGALRYQDFARKAGEQAGAAQFAPQLAREDYFDLSQLSGVGQQRQANLQDQINAEINRYNQLQAIPMTELGNFSQLLGGGGPGSSSTTQPMQSNSGNPWLQGIGTAASLASLFMQS
jgi:hypothetical protein